MSVYSDQELTCADCRGKFVWSARGQELYAEKGYHPPPRCKARMQTKRLGLQKQARRSERGDRPDLPVGGECGPDCSGREHPYA